MNSTSLSSEVSELLGVAGKQPVFFVSPGGRWRSSRSTRSTVRTSHAPRACGDSAPTVPSSRFVFAPSHTTTPFLVALDRAVTKCLVVPGVPEEAGPQAEPRFLPAETCAEDNQVPAAAQGEPPGHGPRSATPACWPGACRAQGLAQDSFSLSLASGHCMSHLSTTLLWP